MSATAIHHFSSPAGVMMDGRAAASDPPSAVAVHPEPAGLEPDEPGPVHHFSSLSETPSTSHAPHATGASEASLQFRVATALAQGMSVSAAARAAGIHRTTIHHWQRTSRDFCAAVDQARREFTESLADDMLDLAHTAIRTLEDLVSNPQIPPAVRLKAALAILERPQFPKRGWNLPVRLETPSQQEVVDGMAELEADYHIVRMTEAIRKHEERQATEPRRSPSGSENVPFEPKSPTAAAHPPVPRRSESSGVQSCEPPHSLHEPQTTSYEPRAQRARNSLCPCGSGQKYKRCCGKDAPPMLTPPCASTA